MSEHLEALYPEAILENKKIIFPTRKSSKFSLTGKLRYWWGWTAAAALLLILGAPSLIFLWLIRRKRWLYPIANFGARMWLKACGATVRVSGTENLAKGENYVFASNHRSYLDTAALFALTGRRVGLVAKKELLKVPIMGVGMGYVNVIAIDRSNPEKARQSMKKAKEVLEEGYSFGLFAEGTRAMPHELLPFKKGAFHLAIQTEAPVIPVAIKNTDWMMGKKQGGAYPGTIEMVLLPPIETKGLNADEDLMDLLRKVRFKIMEELGKDQIDEKF
jgi:1-acyl-sn-glycerol-3-phosphate acyltransferase